MDVGYGTGMGGCQCKLIAGLLFAAAAVGFLVIWRRNTVVSPFWSCYLMIWDKNDEMSKDCFW